MDETGIQTMMIDNKTINQRIENSLNAIFADIDITAAQGRVLMYIANCPDKEIFAADLHKHLCISKPSVSALIKKLRKSGHICCTGCENDERYKNLAVTEKGRKAALLISQHMKNTEREAFCNFTEEEMTEFMRLQKKLLNNISNINTEKLKTERMTD
ncbi:MAG: winged helix-turn-helix transcriptional regulator [Ruminiclostridium sp.]|nr:winged helix-turn-helix transcriptional regulator [Ruminiclostridium sp.]